MALGDRDPDTLPGFIGSANELENASIILGNLKRLFFAANWLLIEAGERDGGGSAEADYGTLSNGPPAGSGGSSGYYRVPCPPFSPGSGPPPSPPDWPASDSYPRIRPPQSTAYPRPSPIPSSIYGRYANGQPLTPDRVSDRINIKGQDRPVVVKRLLTSPITHRHRADAVLSSGSSGRWSMTAIAATWLQTHRELQQRLLSGQAFSFRSLFDSADLDSFVPIVNRVGDMTWRLGREGEGKHRDFPGEMAQVWPKLCDTYVKWCEADNNTWLTDLKRKAAKLPDTIHRAAWADRLRKERHWVEVKGHQVVLYTERDGQTWPRSLTIGDQIGLSRLSGHAFYELAWAGELHVRRFEISGTTRQGLPFEHIELAHRLAEVLAADTGLAPDPAPAEAVEAAYLRRLKATGAVLGPPEPGLTLPPMVQGKPVASYRVGDILVTMLDPRGNDVAYVSIAQSDTSLLLQRDERRGVLAALPLVRGRVQPGSPLMTTPWAGLDLTKPEWRRALCAWGAWLGYILK